MRFYYDLSLIILLLIGLIGISKVLTYWFALHMHTNLHAGKAAEKKAPTKAAADTAKPVSHHREEIQSLPASMLGFWTECGLSPDSEDFSSVTEGYGRRSRTKQAR